MVVKKILLMVLTVAHLACVQAQDVPQWTITVKVIDEQNAPVTNANVKVAWHVPPGPDENIAMTNLSGVTDNNGIFIVSQRSGSIEVFVGAEKTGYYHAGRAQEFAKFKKDDPAKWNPTVTLLLKKVGNPIPMFAKKVETKVQKEDALIGYDLTVGDWIAPIGTGKTPDLYFTVHRKVINQHDYEAQLKLTFPNKGDGIAVATFEQSIGSAFRTPRFAAETRYESERVWNYSNSKKTDTVDGYFLRVRTVLDEKGEVKSALYGKVQGDFRFYVGTKAPRAGMGFDYYLNPMPNDRNLEFDPKHNLLTGLRFEEEVREP